MDKLGIAGLFLAVGAGAVLNLLLGAAAHFLDLPIYLDSIFTILVTIHLGILPGLITAVLTNTALAFAGLVLWPFVCCSILTVLVTGLFLKREGLNNLAGYLWLGLAVGVANGIGGSILSIWLFGGVTDVHGIDRLVAAVYVAGQSLLQAVFWAGLFTNLLDKSLSALTAFSLKPLMRRLLYKPRLAHPVDE